MAKRKIVKIDEDKCNGCGQCIPNCHEAAIQIIDGKARLVSDSLCDGLGACIGFCPQQAITVEERDAAEYNKKNKVHSHTHNSDCPASKAVFFESAKGQASCLSTWPVQIKLIPVTASYLDDADLLIAADCVPFAYANFHSDLLKGKILLVGCPKLDDIQLYKDKIARILRDRRVKSVACVHMEVPCCFGFINIINEAIQDSGRKIPFTKTVISIKGEKSE